PAACRFVPTCSDYASEAIQSHGIIKGGRLAVWRLLRCHPFCKNCDQFTHDPVPKKF
ncbi:MAG: membrane protein insertion efficiency factor YidD, partial [Pseudomonadota bacterium]